MTDCIQNLSTKACACTLVAGKVCWQIWQVFDSDLLQQDERMNLHLQLTACLHGGKHVCQSDVTQWHRDFCS